LSYHSIKYRLLPLPGQSQMSRNSFRNKGNRDFSKYCFPDACNLPLAYWSARAEVANQVQTK